MGPAEEQKAIDEAAAKLPERFGLRAFPDKVFKINRSQSYVSDVDREVMLYTYVLSDDGEWKAFAKGTVDELLREVIAVTPHAKIASSR